MKNITKFLIEIFNLIKQFKFTVAVILFTAAIGIIFGIFLRSTNLSTSYLNPYSCEIRLPLCENKLSSEVSQHNELKESTKLTSEKLTEDLNKALFNQKDVFLKDAYKVTENEIYIDLNNGSVVFNYDINELGKATVEVKEKLFDTYSDNAQKNQARVTFALSPIKLYFNYSSSIYNQNEPPQNISSDDYMVYNTQGTVAYSQFSSIYNEQNLASGINYGKNALRTAYSFGIGNKFSVFNEVFLHSKDKASVKTNLEQIFASIRFTEK